jgi:hypothetical protein
LLPDAVDWLAAGLAVVCDYDRVDRDGLAGSLALVRYQVETATARFAALTEGVDHPRMDSARSRLQAAGVAVVQAAGGLSRWTRTWLDAAELAVVCWAVAVTGAVFAMLLADLVAGVWDRYSIRTLACGVQVRTVEDVTAAVRARIAQITASLETDHDDTHLAVGQQIEYALIWLDATEQAPTEPPG